MGDGDRRVCKRLGLEGDVGRGNEGLVVDGFWGRSGTLWIGGRLIERLLRMILLVSD